MPLRKLEPAFYERIWGIPSVAHWFPDHVAGSEPIGEVWFQTPDVPILVKFLFTSQNLSVQVHPEDVYAQLHHNSPGKTEMWHVLAAEKGAKIAAGFREPVTGAELVAAARDGTIVDRLEWFDARPGDTFFLPAGTVHAIGAGLTICEIQQPSDITYRLYDYGRRRNLHLDHSLAVSRLGAHAARATFPVVCPYFVTEPLNVSGRAKLSASSREELLIAIEGDGIIDAHRVQRGDVFLRNSSTEEVEIKGNVRFLRTFFPDPENKQLNFAL